MRYFFRQKVPKFAHVLLVESGSRHLVEHLLRSLRQHWDLELMIDLVTCYTGVPAGFPPELPTPHTPPPAAPYTRVFRVFDYAAPPAAGASIANSAPTATRSSASSVPASPS